MILVIGGQCANVGKTGVMTHLLDSLRELDWTAVKVGLQSHDMPWFTDAPSFLREERIPQSRTDAGRYLAAGARHAFTLHTNGRQLEAGLPLIAGLAAKSSNLMLESNSIVPHLQPDLYLSVIDFGQPEWRESALDMLDRVDAFVVVETEHLVPDWGSVPLERFGGRPMFRVSPLCYGCRALTEFVRSRLTTQRARPLLPTQAPEGSALRA